MVAEWWCWRVELVLARAHGRNIAQESRCAWAIGFGFDIAARALLLNLLKMIDHNPRLHTVQS